MFLKKEDINNSILDEKISKHYDNSNEYLSTYVVPEYVAHFIANGYYNSYMFSQPFDLIINTCIEHINVNVELNEKLKNDIIDLLRIKYSLVIENENPLSFKKND